MDTPKLQVVGKISGLSAYEIAVKNGFEGTEQEWLASLGSAMELEEVSTTTATIEPDHFTVFGVVSELSVTLQEAENDGYVHEYCFEFTTADEFNGLTITPAPKWVSEPVLSPNKTYQVSIVREIGVIVGA